MTFPFDALADQPRQPETPALEPLRYTLRFPAPQNHYIEVESVVPAGNSAEIELEMAVWTPGSYLVREYSRHVEDVRAESDGQPEFALVNGAPTFLTLAGDGAKRPHEVRLELPGGWRRSLTALDAVPGAPHHYRAPDFDTLVDSPIVAGNPAVYEFSVGGKPHFLVNVGEGDGWAGARSGAEGMMLVGAQAGVGGHGRHCHTAPVAARSGARCRFLNRLAARP